MRGFSGIPLELDELEHWIGGAEPASEGTPLRETTEFQPAYAVMLAPVLEPADRAADMPRRERDPTKPAGLCRT
jgi:hypothetical protein